MLALYFFHYAYPHTFGKFPRCFWVYQYTGNIFMRTSIKSIIMPETSSPEYFCGRLNFRRPYFHSSQCGALPLGGVVEKTMTACKCKIDSIGKGLISGN